MKPKLYVETSVISYLTSRPSRDIVTAARQELTRQWWSDKRSGYELYISGFVISEAASGNFNAAAQRLEAIEGIPAIELSETAVSLAEALVHAGPLPEKAVLDALHIAAAVSGGVDYASHMELRAPCERGHTSRNRAALSFERIRTAYYSYTGGVNGGLSYGSR